MSLDTTENICIVYNYKPGKNKTLPSINLEMNVTTSLALLFDDISGFTVIRTVVIYIWCKVTGPNHQIFAIRFAVDRITEYSFKLNSQTSVIRASNTRTSVKRGFLAKIQYPNYNITYCTDDASSGVDIVMSSVMRSRQFFLPYM